MRRSLAAGFTLMLLAVGAPTLHEHRADTRSLYDEECPLAQLGASKMRVGPCRVVDLIACCLPLKWYSPRRRAARPWFRASRSGRAARRSPSEPSVSITARRCRVASDSSREAGVALDRRTDSELREQQGDVREPNDRGRVVIGGPFASRTRTARATLTLVAVLIGYAACHSKSSSGPSGSAHDLLVELNASQNDGRTVRWASLPIPVFLNGIARADEVNSWAAATGGAVTFTFVDSPPASGVSFRFGGGNDVCGTTFIDFESDGRITSVDIQVVQAIFRGPNASGPSSTRPATPSDSWPIRRTAA